MTRVSGGVPDGGRPVADAPLVVAVLHPELAMEELRQRIVSERPLDIRVVPYVDSERLRNAKATSSLGPEFLQREAVLSPAQREALAGAEVLLAVDLPHDIVRLAPRLRWVQCFGSGVEHVQRMLAGTPMCITTAAGVGATSIAEFVWARLLHVWKSTDEIADLQRARRWRAVRGRAVAGSTIGVIGLGAIGTAVARLGKAFGTEVVAVRARPHLGSDIADVVVGPERLHEVLRRSDAVVVAAPATPDTHHLIDRSALAAMRHDAILCNVARGSLVDEVALLAALLDGHLQAAILDVTGEEPLPPTHPLWTAPRTHLSAHCSNSTKGYTDHVVDLFADNLSRYLDGRTLRNVLAADGPVAGPIPAASPGGVSAP